MVFDYRTYTSLIEDCDTLSEHLGLITEMDMGDGTQPQASGGGLDRSIW